MTDLLYNSTPEMQVLSLFLCSQSQTGYVIGRYSIIVYIINIIIIDETRKEDPKALNFLR